jgi:CRP/FNR family transcriptional regulator/CRP/FNR family cyclic AMP-dependent transcriptional regulator
MSSTGIINGGAPPRDSGDLRSITVFRSLSRPDLDRIFPALRASAVRRGRTLNMCDKRACFVWSGSFRLVVAVPALKVASLRRLKSGDCFGQLAPLSAAGNNRIRIVCDDAGQLLEMNADQFANFRQEIPALAEATLLAMATVVAAQESRIFELLALNTRGRVRAELLRLAQGGDGRNGDGAAHCPTQQTLAEQAGTSREVVSRILREFAEEELIRMERRGIEILDINRLLALDEADTGRRMFDPATSDG